MSDSTALCKRNKDRTVFCIFCASSRVLVKKSWLILTLVKSVKKLAWNMHHEDRTEISDLFSFFERTRRTGVLSFFSVVPAGNIRCATDWDSGFFSLKNRMFLLYPAVNGQKRRAGVARWCVPSILLATACMCRGRAKAFLS